MSKRTTGISGFGLAGGRGSVAAPLEVVTTS
jgi:hypothetical protein